MNRDPSRWLQDPSVDPRMSELLRSASPPLDLPVAVQTRIEATLQQLANGAASAGAAGAGALASKAWLIVGSLAVSALVGGVVWQRVDTPTRSVAQTVVPLAAVGAPAVPALSVAERPATSVVEPPVATVSELALEPEFAPALGAAATAVNATVKLHARPTTPTAGSNLAEEARLLETARASISTDPAAAHRTLALYDRRFPNGALKQERSLVAVRLAVAEGRRGEAKTRAVELEQSAKGSPFAKKALELVDSDERAKASRTINE